MALQHPISDEAAELIARRFHVLADPTRIKLLDHLHDGEATVQDLVDVVGSSQQNVSKHLGLLMQAGILGRHKNGGGPLHYRVVDDSIWKLCEDVCEAVERRLERLQAALHG